MTGTRESSGAARGALGDGRWLLAVAAPKELEAVRAGGPRAGLTAVLTGVGKANAGIAAARALGRGAFDGVVSLGIAGSLDDRVGVGDVVVADASVFADEGAERAGGWETTGDFGFPMVGPGVDPALATHGGMGVRCDGVVAGRLVSALGGAGMAAHVGGVATVSVCSGTDERRRLTVERTGAIAEAMEGAAVGLAACSATPAVAFVEVRVISNRTGDDARWDLAGALGVLTRVVGVL